MNLNLQCQDVSKALLSHPGQPEVFASSPVICLDGNKFVLLSVVIPLEMIFLKIWVKYLPKNVKSPLQAYPTSLKALYKNYLRSTSEI